MEMYFKEMIASMSSNWTVVKAEPPINLVNLLIGLMFITKPESKKKLDYFNNRMTDWKDS